jgi:signal peptidase II
MKSRPAIVAGTALATVVLDQLTKWWARSTLDDRTIDLVWTLRLNLVLNRGAAFGLGSRYAPLVALLATVVLLVLLRTSRTLHRVPALIAIGLVLGGAVGNLLDRLFRDGHGFLGGAVVDFVDLQWWPVFNVADAAIVCGAVVLALSGTETVRTDAPAEA